MPRRANSKKNTVSPVPGLDPGIGPFVEILRNNGIETFESCQGGRGHAYPEPTIRFGGSPGDGFRAFAIAREHPLPVSYLRRIWVIQNDGEPTGPYWELVFHKTADQVTCLRYQA
jgi:hypothetical protein